MCHDGPCPVKKNHGKTCAMKTLKMCFGKGGLKQRESIEPGKVFKICLSRRLLKVVHFTVLVSA